MTYLITGPNGSGKSTVGRALVGRDYEVLEADFDPELSGWFDNATSQRVGTLPPLPFSSEWLGNHQWLWDEERLKNLIATRTDKPFFLVGGAYNQAKLYHLFTKHFTLYTDDATSVKRLQARGEGQRWQDGSPELTQMLTWNKISKQRAEAAGSITIDGGQPVETIIDILLSHCSLSAKSSKP